MAHLAGVPDSIVTRAESVSKEFFADLQEKLAKRRRSKLSSLAQAGQFISLGVSSISRVLNRVCWFLGIDFAFLVNACDPTKKVMENDSMKLAALGSQLDIIRRSVRVE